MTHETARTCKMFLILATLRSPRTHKLYQVYRKAGGGYTPYACRARHYTAAEFQALTLPHHEIGKPAHTARQTLAR